MSAELKLIREASNAAPHRLYGPIALLVQAALAHTENVAGFAQILGAIKPGGTAEREINGGVALAKAVLAMPHLTGPVSSPDTPPAPRAARVWRDNAGDLWREHDEDEPVLVKLLEFNGKPADPHNGPVLLSDVREQWGPLTVEPSPSTQTGGHP